MGLILNFVFLPLTPSVFLPHVFSAFLKNKIVINNLSMKCFKTFQRLYLPLKYLGESSQPGNTLFLFSPMKNLLLWKSFKHIQKQTEWYNY